MRVWRAAAAVCVVAASACSTSQPPPASVPSRASPSAPGAMPAHYVVVAGLDVVVRASADGHVTGTVAIPVPAGTARASAGAEVFGGLDDRHFVIVASRGGDLLGVSEDTLFLLTVSPDGRPGRLVRLGFDNRGVPVTGVALSPDGTTVVLSLTNEFPGQAYGSVVLINVRTGATRTWTGQGDPGYWPGIPSWAGDGTVEVPWWHGGPAGTVPASLTGVRQLNLASPGGSLLSAPLVTYPAPVQGLQSAMIAPGGGYVVASSCRPGPARHTGIAQIIELSPATGRAVEVLLTQTTRFGNNADVRDAISSTCRVLSAVDGGDLVLAQAFAFGRIDHGAFTSLPGTSPHVLPVSAAW